MSSAKYYRSRITNVTESISSHHKTPWTEMEDSIVREAIEEVHLSFRRGMFIGIF